MITNPAYEQNLKELRKKVVILGSPILLVVVLFPWSILLVLFGHLRLNIGIYLLLAAVLQVFVISLIDRFRKDRFNLMLKHGLVDSKWHVDTERKYGEMALRLASAFNIKPVKVKIIEDYGSFSYAERRFFNHIIIPVRAYIELDDKQIEFLVASALVAFPQNLLEKYSTILASISCALMFLVTKHNSIYVIILVGVVFVALSSLFAISSLLMLIGLTIRSKSVYTRILAVTRDYESAKTALMTESELAHRRMQMRTTETLINNYRNLGVCEEKAAISTLGIAKEINKLRQAAEELGLDVEKGRTDDKQSSL